MTCEMLLMPMSGSIGGSNDGSGEGEVDTAPIARSPGPATDSLPREHAAAMLAARSSDVTANSGRAGIRTTPMWTGMLPAAPPERANRSGGRIQDERWHRRLGEVELVREVTELRGVLPHGRPRVGPPVGQRVEPLAAQESILDQLEIGVERQRLVIDVAATRPRADHDARHTDAVAVLIDLDGLHV